MQKISIGLPVYNGARYLRRTIETILAQSFPDFELILLDNASTDETPDICQTYAAVDNRIRVLRNRHNIGAVPNWNLALGMARFPYFKWAAYDDVHEATFLEKTYAVMEADGGVVLCHTQSRFVDEDEQDLPFDPVRNSYVDRLQNKRAGAPMPGRATSKDPVQRFRDIFLHTVRCVDQHGLIRTDVLRKTAKLRSYFGSDRALLVELALYGRFHEVQEPLFLKRDHGSTSLNLPEHEKQRWIDPQAGFIRLQPRHRQYLQAIEAISRAPLTPKQRLHCLAIILGRLSWNRLSPAMVLRRADQLKPVN